MNPQLTADLNSAQQQAVTTKAPHLIVLAGAGSGKTRVLVRRIAWAIIEQGLSPFNVLAVTFTNKAAGEMKHRVESLLEINVTGSWIGTFHSLAHRFLRQHWQQAGLPENFQIIDADEQLRLIKRILKNKQINEKELDAKNAQRFINANKEAAIRPSQVTPQFYQGFEARLDVYQAYEAACETSGLVDFAEILLCCYETLKQNPELLSSYQQRFRHVLVDEFQDTNSIQYNWLKLLAGGGAAITVVGDDDQSIYSWRGAEVANIRNFQKDFNNVEVIRLEQNYRSTSNILRAANILIANNLDRLGKELWTQDKSGEPITVYEAFDERDEAFYIVATLQSWVATGKNLNDIAILYRSNAQSRILEEALLRSQINYVIYGGLRFFARAEIKDALAYLRLLANSHDDTAFERVINVPKRGIGDRTVAAIRQLAIIEGESMWQTAEKMIAENALSPAAHRALAAFLQLINELKAEIESLSLAELIDAIIKKSDLITHYEQEGITKAKNRKENLEELVNAAEEFIPQAQEELSPVDIITEFLAEVSLDAGEQQLKDDKPAIKLMTLHAAKGLEFPVVFIAGLEEGLFPHIMALSEENRLEEERRLCYVGITRAKQKLYLTYASSRNTRGYSERRRPSRFIGELPQEVLEVLSQSINVTEASSYSSRPHKSASTKKILANDLPFKLGQQVRHTKFGEGLIINFEGSGREAKVLVKFGSSSKWLMLEYAKLEAV